MKLYHYTRKAFKLNKNQVYYSTNNLTYKPNGLWVSVGNSWKNWCYDEDWNKGGFKYTYEIILKPTAKILIINTLQKLDNFYNKYKIDESHCKSPKYFDINWIKLSFKYDGIIITKYFYQRRFEYHWYYGWDVASGCLWNLNNTIKKKILCKS